jgi:AAA family ATP:ADP antiporter
MKLLRDVLRLEPGEGAKVAWFAVLAFLLQAGIAIGISTSDALFLSHVGADHLPYIYLITPLVMLAYIAVYARAQRRWGIDRTIDATLVVVTIGGIALHFLVSYANGNPDAPSSVAILYAAKLYSFLWYIALYTLFWNFVDGFFDLQDGKRLFALLSAGASLGAAVGGAIASILSHHVGISELYLVWAAFALCAVPLVRSLRVRWTKVATIDDLDIVSAADQSPMRSIVKAIFGSRFAASLSSLLFITMMATLVIEYQYLSIFETSGSAAELTELFGTLFLVTNLANLFLNLFIFNRLVAWLGVPSLVLLQPLVYLAGFVWLLIDSSMPAAIFGFFAYHTILTAIDYNSTNLLLNALPRSGKKQIRAFIEGICEPGATAVVGIALLLTAGIASPQQICFVGAVIAVASLLCALVVKNNYLDALISNLRGSWLDFSPRSKAETREALGDSRSVRGLLEKVVNASPEERRKLEQAVIKIGLKAVPPLVATLREGHRPYPVRSSAARTLVKLAPSQLDGLCSCLINHEISNLEYRATSQQALANNLELSPDSALLCRFYRDRAFDGVCFIVELLCLSGQLANYESIVLALRSVRSKDRGDAIESIQLALTSRLGARLTAVLKGAHPVSGVPMQPSEIISRALASEDSREKLSAQIAAEKSENPPFGERSALLLALAQNPHLSFASIDSLFRLAEETAKEGDACLLGFRLATLIGLARTDPQFGLGLLSHWSSSTSSLLGVRHAV